MEGVSKFSTGVDSSQELTLCFPVSQRHDKLSLINFKREEKKEVGDETTVYICSKKKNHDRNECVSDIPEH